RPRPEEIEYEKIRPRYPDTVEAQWSLAEWCRQNTLLAERKVHLERILELNPDHEQARRVLGYFRKDGQWTTRQQVMEDRGMVWYQGEYRLPQEIQLIEEKEKIEAASGQWKRKLGLWRGWIGGNKTPLAYENIRGIADPFAVEALAAALSEDSGDDHARLAYIEALARIGTTAARQALAAQALRDPVAEVRLTCLDYLKQGTAPDVVDYFIGRLRSGSNIEVLRAAVALGHLEAKSAVGPLIGALVTGHKYKIGGGNPGQMTTGFSSGPGGSPGGLSMGGQGPKIITRYFNNQAVLDALVSLGGGVDYGFDVARWKAWYAARKRLPGLDARRD
ncbi:MAG: hypothetical protein ABIK89_00720, partial [Planctomycetota bacterium]